MAPSGPSVAVKQNASGDYVLGATINKVFVPFASVSKAHAAAIIAKGSRSSSSSGGDEEEAS